MNLKTLKVFDGYIGGSTLERPVKPEHMKPHRTDLREFFRDPNGNREKEKEYKEALTAYENSFLPMEDNETAQSLVMHLIPEQAFGEFLKSNKLKVGTEVSVDLEVEEVRQFKFAPHYYWRDVPPTMTLGGETPEYRNVYRIVAEEKPVDQPKEDFRCGEGDNRCNCKNRDECAYPPMLEKFKEIAKEHGKPVDQPKEEEKIGSLRQKYNDKITKEYKETIAELIGVIESAGNPSSFNYPSSMIPTILRRAKSKFLQKAPNMGTGRKKSD